MCICAMKGFVFYRAFFFFLRDKRGGEGRRVWLSFFSSERSCLVVAELNWRLGDGS